jgi:hypothetical protein
MGEDHPSPAVKFHGLAADSWSSIVEMLQCAATGAITHVAVDMVCLAARLARTTVLLPFELIHRPPVARTAIRSSEHKGLPSLQGPQLSTPLPEQRLSDMTPTFVWFVKPMQLSDSTSFAHGRSGLPAPMRGATPILCAFRLSNFQSQHAFYLHRYYRRLECLVNTNVIGWIMSL